MLYHVKTSGMGCKHCIARVTGAMNALEAKIVRMELNDFEIDYEGDKNAVRRSIEDLGFEVISIEAV